MMPNEQASIYPGKTQRWCGYPGREVSLARMALVMVKDESLLRWARGVVERYENTPLTEAQVQAQISAYYRPVRK